MTDHSQQKVLVDICEILRECRSALLVVDLQNDNTGSDGALARAGVDVTPFRSILPKTMELLAVARQKGVPVIFTRNTLTRGNRGESSAQLRHLSRSRHIVDLTNYVQEGTWGNEVVDDLTVQPEDIQIVKYRSSAFHGTPLDMLLRHMRIDVVVVTGIVTEGCVESTVRDLVGFGYFPVVVADAVASSRQDLHEAALKIMSARYDVVVSDVVFSAWDAGSARDGDQ